MAQAKSDASDLMKHPFGGYIFFSENEGCIYIADSKDLNSATNVWKWGLGGLGFSSTGINGTYETAITQDGSIVADFIKTGIISASRIEGYGSLIATVNSISTDINNNYTSIEELEQILQNQKNTITTEMTTQYLQDMDSFSFDIINKINQDGVTSLKNTMVTIDENGINTAKNNEDVVSLLDNQGVYVSDGKKREDNSNVIMKVDRDGGYLKTLEVKSTIKEQDLIQKEKIDDETYGECQGWYWIGSDI